MAGWRRSGASSGGVAPGGGGLGRGGPGTDGERPRRLPSPAARLVEGCSLGGRHQHLVDHVDDAVAGDHVRLDHRGVAVEHHAAAAGVDGDVGALDGGRGVEAHDVGGAHVTADHVVGEDGRELVAVLGEEEVLDGPLGERGEGLVGGREDREGPLALQRVDEAGGLHGGHEGLEAPGRDGRVDDVARRGLVAAHVGHLVAAVIRGHLVAAGALRAHVVASALVGAAAEARQRENQPAHQKKSRNHCLLLGPGIATRRPRHAKILPRKS